MHASSLYAALCWAETMMVTDILDFPFPPPPIPFPKVPFHISDTVPLLRVLYAFSCPFFYGGRARSSCPLPEVHTLY